MQRTDIDWPWQPLYTWNPITGCKRGCAYCYARRIHERFNRNVPFSDVVLHADRLNDPLRLRKSSYVFVGSMTDIAYWSEIQKHVVITSCTPGHTYLFLSKSADAYVGMERWETSHMFGLTVTGTGKDEYSELVKFNACTRYHPVFLSVEPLIGMVDIPADLIDRCQHVIVGAMTGPGAIRPQVEWVEHLRARVPSTKLYFKKSMGG